MISARARVIAPQVITDANDGPGDRTPEGGCFLKFKTAFVSFGQITRCWANPHYYARGFLVTPPGLTRWGYVEVDNPFLGFVTKLVPVDPLLLLPPNSWATTTDAATFIKVKTAAGAYRWFGAFGLAIVADVALYAKIVCIGDGTNADFQVDLEYRVEGGRWVSITATGWNSSDYSGAVPGDAADAGDSLWVASARRINPCGVGYLMYMTTGEITPATCPVSGAAPGWIDQPAPATIVNKPFAIGAVQAYSV